MSRQIDQKHVVLFLGANDSRTHALVEAIAASPLVKKIFVAPGSAGSQLVKKAENVSIDLNNVDEIVQLAKKLKPTLAIVGPENPLIAGIADRLRAEDIPVYGPNADGALFEGSKALTSDFVQEYQIPSPQQHVFHAFKKAKEFVEKPPKKFPDNGFVIKADGAVFGKGVTVCSTKKDALATLQSYMVDEKFGEFGKTVVIQEKLVGFEASVQVVIDGKRYFLLPTAEDYKQAFDNDEGPMTGGIGAQSPHPLLTKKHLSFIKKEIIEPTIKGFKDKKVDFRGTIFIGLMITEKSPMVLEYNVRFGDPEIPTILARHKKKDIFPLLYSAATGASVKGHTLTETALHSITVTLCSAGYPEHPQVGVEIHGLDKKLPNGVKIFQAGTKKEGDKYLTAGGRVLVVVATGKTPELARDKAYSVIGEDGVHFEGMHYRTDIGARKRPGDKKGMSYASTGVNYDQMDPMKRLAQLKAAGTAKNLEKFGMYEVGPSRGESAYVWEELNSYKAFVIEGLGTKNLVADATRKITKKTYYDQIAQDTVAMIVNDLIVVGASPQVINAYFAVGDSAWFNDQKRSKDLVEGWAKACDLSGAVWGGGETPTLKGIINPDTIDLSGAATGIIQPKERLTLGEKLTVGDAIVLIESSGIHANGLTLARTIADKLPKGYATKLSDGKGYGESLLIPTHLYAKLVQAYFEAGLDIHYMVNITGHGWRKLMRAPGEFTYRLNKIPKPQPVFAFLQKHSGNDDKEMYGNFNMGAGFAVFLPKSDVAKAKLIAKKFKLKADQYGSVEKGHKQVIIEPKKLTYKENELAVR